MSRRPASRLVLLFTPILAAALATSGCGGSSSASTDGAKPKITIAYQKFPSGDLVVKHDKLLETALPGYTIEWKVFDSGASINTAFVADAVDIAAIGSSPVARGLSDPLNIPYKVAFVLDVAGANEALVARNGSGVSTIAGLKGHRIATPFASTSHYSLLAALTAAGLTDKDVTLVDLQPQDIVAAWKRGDIDAAYVWLPTLEELKQTGTVLVDSAAVAKDGKPTLDLGVVSDDLISKHPEVVDAWRKAETTALAQVREQPDTAAKAVAAELSITEADAKSQLSQGIFLSPAEITSSTWLGSGGKPGDIVTNLLDAAQFLADQKKIPSAPSRDAIAAAIYTKGLPDVLTK